MATKTVFGKDLKVGDTIEVWWTPKRDTITKLEPYAGPLAYLWPKGAQLATFALCGGGKGGMTIDNDDTYELMTP